MFPFIYSTSYAASKHAVQGYFDSLRAEIAAHAITCTVISPGYIRTSLSLNAVTGDGTTYGKMDETTAGGMNSNVAAMTCLRAIARGTVELVLADAKACAAVQAKVQFPELLAKKLAVKGISVKKND